MIATHWIVCERMSRWAAALRTALAQHSLRDAVPKSLDEVRNLDDLTARLHQFPSSLVLLEVTLKNLDAILAWLADTARRSPHAMTVALLDIGFSGGSDSDRNANRDNQAEVAAARRESGAAEVVLSPRLLQPVLSLGRHFATKNRGPAPYLTADQSIEKWAWSLLPWQGERRPLG
jgi:hypothetical protein